MLDEVAVMRRILESALLILLLLLYADNVQASISVAQSLSATEVQLPYLSTGGPYTPVDITTSAFQGRDLILHIENASDITVDETIVLVLPPQFEFDQDLNDLQFIDATPVGGAFVLDVHGDSLILTCETNIGGGGNIRFLSIFANSDSTTTAPVTHLPVNLTGTATIDYTQSTAGFISAVSGPQVVFTAPQQDSTATDGGDGGYAFTCSGSLTDILGATYSLYWSTEPELSLIDTSAFAAVDLNGVPLINLPAGDLLEDMLTADLIENEELPYYLYATSSLTTTRIVGRSGWLRVYHFPAVIHIDPDSELYLDSGQLYNPESGNADGSGTPQVMLGFAVTDLDSDPWISLYYGPQDIPATAIQTSGASPSLTVVGLSGCTPICPEPLNSTQYSEYPWSVYSSADEWVPLGEYGIYAVVSDGFHVVLRESAAPVSVYHTPVIDLQTPPSTLIDLERDFSFTFNWGETVEGDRDADDDALISFYIDSSIDSLADFSQSFVDQLCDSITAYDGVLENGELLFDAIHEDPDQPQDNMYAWYPSDLPRTLATDILNCNDYLHLYALIADDSTSRLGSFNDGSNNFIDPDEAISTFSFQAAANVMLVDPPPLGAAISVNESYLVRWVYAWNFGDPEQQLFLLLGDEQFSAQDSSWSDLTGALDNIWVMNSSDGTVAQHYDTPAGSCDSWDFLPNTMTGPAIGDGLTLEESGDGTYHVFLVVSSNPAGEAPADDDPVFCAPGTLDLNGFGSGVSYNLQLRPYLFDTFPGDTITIDIYPQTEINTADMISLYIDVDTAAFAIVELTAPFQLGPDFQAASVLENDNHGGDLSQGRHHLDFTYFENGAPIPEFNDGSHLLCSLRLLPRRNPSTGYTIDNLVLAVDDEANRFTSFYQDGNLLGTTIQSPAAIAHTWARGRISGHVQLQGRDFNSLECSFTLREPGSWLPANDSLFLLNDSNSELAGVQLQLNDDGTYDLHSLPDGCWELVAQVPGWLSGYYPFDIQHGEQLQGVNPHLDANDVDLLQLTAGDCAGYVDSSGTSGPDNQIDATDLNAIVEAYGSSPDSMQWNPLCDFNGDDQVYIVDLTLCTTNLNSNGVPPVYRTGSSRNSTPIWELESHAHNGLTTWQLYLRDVTDMIGWSAKLALPAEDIVDLQLLPVLDSGAGEQVVIANLNSTMLQLAAARRGDSPGVEGDLLVAEFSLRDSDGRLPVLLLSGQIIDSQFASSSGELSTPPAAFELPAPWPNPFNSTVSIPLIVYDESPLEVTVYNLLGQEVDVLFRDTITAGAHVLNWQASGIAGGIYFVRAHNSSHQQTCKLIYLP